MEKLDIILESLNHPFIAMIFGLLFWFCAMWALYKPVRNENIPFLVDQKEEIALSLIGGMAFLIFDDELIEFYHWYKGDVEAELQFFYYFLVAPVVERVLWFISMMKKKRS
jgi:hypothetical protein